MVTNRNTAENVSVANIANVVQLAKTLVLATQGNDIGTTINGVDTISDDALTMYIGTALLTTIRENT